MSLTVKGPIDKLDSVPHFMIYYVHNGEINYEDDKETWITRRRLPTRTVSVCTCIGYWSGIMSTPKNLPWEPAKIGTKSFIEDIYYDEVDAYEMEDIIESLETH